ncbi:MAG: 4Fe-4S dicluster domain-containing protein [Hyphomicrobiaceae bacterium]|nr:4Fe-4S dicluster domain-containing protein [Hyphomicrobiaceae bacterium]
MIAKADEANGGCGAGCSCATRASDAGEATATTRTVEGADPVDVGRRWFMKAATAFSTTVIAPGVTLMAFAESDPAIARPADQPVSSKHRFGLLIDLAKCPSGCSDCVTACSTENGWKLNGRPETDAQWIRKLTVTNRKDGSSFSLPMMCQHCADPPCVDVCPTGASFKRADGIVLVDKHICIGCRYCMMACPYKARSFIHEPLEDQKPHAPRGKGCVESCTMCVHRVDAGGTPACVEACAKAGHSAMIFGDLNDPASEIAKRVATYRTTRIRDDLGTDPGVYYQNL